MLGPVPARSPPAGYEALQRSEFSRAFGTVIGVRAYLAPVMATLALSLAAFEPSAWRRAVLIGLPLVLVSVSILEVLRFRRRGMAPGATEANLMLFVFGQPLVALATGGLESPVMPVVLVIALFTSLLITHRPWYYWLGLGTQLAAPWVFAGLAIASAVPDFNPRLLGGGPRAGHSDLHLVLAALFLNLGTFIAYRVGGALRQIFDSILWRALEANDELRREHAERAQTLVALTGEIAHELKNPMASVKGLASLLGQQLVEGKGAERLQVLRQEVDRMQVILEEFLNFSRPLLPLAVERVQLRGLCAEVVALHEGLARERGVALALGGEAEVRCDGRKVRQVLINLVQNALDASPAGATVELACAGSEAGATVRVLDRGPGLEASIAARLFQPGATTKARGNGMGLTVARSLARQHGGELTLGPREGGGCAGVLTLPPEPRVEAAAGGRAGAAA
jgi:two-component system, NtrC family, sensor histidine kinase HydH